MTEQSIIGVHDTIPKAEEAIHQFDQDGFPVKTDFPNGYGRSSW
jgi:hypothetical protein